MIPETLRRYNSKQPEVKIFFILDIFLTKCIRYLVKGFFKKCSFRRFFKSKCKSFHLFLVVFSCIPAMLCTFLQPSGLGLMLAEVFIPLLWLIITINTKQTSYLMSAPQEILLVRNGNTHLHYHLASTDHGFDCARIFLFCSIQVHPSARLLVD